MYVGISMYICKIMYDVCVRVCMWGRGHGRMDVHVL